MLKIALPALERREEKQSRHEHQSGCDQCGLAGRRASHDQNGRNDWAEDEKEKHQWKMVKIFCPLNTRKDAKISETNIRRFLLSGEEALVFEFWVMAEVHEQT